MRTAPPKGWIRFPWESVVTPWKSDCNGVRSYHLLRSTLPAGEGLHRDLFYLFPGELSLRTRIHYVGSMYYPFVLESLVALFEQPRKSSFIAAVVSVEPAWTNDPKDVSASSMLGTTRRTPASDGSMLSKRHSSLSGESAKNPPAPSPSEVCGRCQNRSIQSCAW
jgi:hypothetical protein